MTGLKANDDGNRSESVVKSLIGDDRVFICPPCMHGNGVSACEEGGTFNKLLILRKMQTWLQLMIGLYSCTLVEKMSLANVM